VDCWLLPRRCFDHGFFLRTRPFDSAELLGVRATIGDVGQQLGVAGAQ